MSDLNAAAAELIDAVRTMLHPAEWLTANAQTWQMVAALPAEEINASPIVMDQMRLSQCLEALVRAAHPSKEE